MQDGNSTEFKMFAAKVRREMERPRRVAAHVANPPRTGDVDADDQLDLRAARLESSDKSVVSEVLAGVARYVANELLSNDHPGQARYVEALVSRHGDDGLRELIEAVDEQVEVLEWWFTEPA